MENLENLESVQGYLNGYLSSFRNSVITLSLGIVIYGFSRSFKKISSRNIMKNLSTVIYLVSLSLITVNNISMNDFLNSLTDEEKKRAPKYVNFDNWKRYEYIGWGFSIIVIIVIYMSMLRYTKYFLNIF